MYIQVVSTALHVLWCQLLVNVAGLGLIGTSIAVCITYWINFVGIIVYLEWAKRRDSPFSKTIAPCGLDSF